MATDKVYGGSNNMNILLQHDKLPSSSSSEVLNSLWIPISSSSFHGSKSMVSFENGHGGDNTTDRPYFQMLCKEEQRDEDFDGCFHQPEKKRRLTVDQVHYLESNFEVDNKLEPDRKIQLAKELGLQPRQVAIWFQNRRARYKTKQLEKDYDSLRTSYEKLKVDYECRLKEQEKLRNEVNLLKDRLALQDEEKANSEPFDSTHPSMAEPQKPIQVASSEKSNNSAMVVCKHEDASSAKSDVFDSDIPPHYIDGDHSSLMEPANSSHVFEPDLSDHSQEDEEDNLSNSLFPPPPPLSFPKLEDGCYHDLPPNSCNFGFLANDQPFWLFPY